MASGMTKTQLTRHLGRKSSNSTTRLPQRFLEHLADTAIKETKKSGVFVVPVRPRPLVESAPQSPYGTQPTDWRNRFRIKAKTVVKFRVAKAAKDAIAPKK